MSKKPNQKEINMILNILKGAPFYIDTPLDTSKIQKNHGERKKELNKVHHSYITGLLI
jgi:hypothetical protein